MDAARQLGWGVEGQLERGEEGTEHYQLMVRTPQVRFAAVKKVFPTAHIEVARNRKALEQYVHKEESRVEPLKSIEVSFLTYPQVRTQFFKWLVDRRFFETRASDPDDRLRLWDEFIGLSIEEGMHVDLIGMNPQHRGCISKYWRHYIAYEYSRRQTDERSQLDSQSPENSVAVPSIPNALHSSLYSPPPPRSRSLTPYDEALSSPAHG